MESHGANRLVTTLTRKLVLMKVYSNATGAERTLYTHSILVYVYSHKQLAN